MAEPVTILGAGLAGCEAAWQLANRGIPVTLWEMKPDKMTPAHHSPLLGELVCSNSLRSDQLENAVGLLKEELRQLNSLILRCADTHRVAAGGALAVDRMAFSQAITEAIQGHPNITLQSGEVKALPEEGQVIVATGPLTADDLAQDIARRLPAGGYLHFYDAAAPLVTFESIDMDSAWFASRYDKGTADYINCPLTQEEYLAFWRELCAAKDDGYYYAAYDSCSTDSLTFSHGEYETTYSKTTHRYLFDLGYVKAGETVSVTNTDADAVRFNVYELSIAAVESAYNTLNEQTISVDDFSDTHIRGHIDVKQAGQLVLSIPSEKGWTMKVDGKDVEYEDFSDTFVSIHLDEGEHEIELYYETPGLKAGAAISAGCVCIFLLLLLFRQIVKRRSRLKFKENSDR